MKPEKIAEAFAGNHYEHLFEANGVFFTSDNNAKNAFPKAEVTRHEREAYLNEIKAAEAAIKKQNDKLAEQRPARPAVLNLEAIWYELQTIKQTIAGKTPAKTVTNEPAN